MFAIVDVETTGGHAAQNGMTEIAIVHHDGKNITHRYSTLLNPGKSIPHFIEQLTGINNHMVLAAPTFAEKAIEIEALLKERIFVAHNVNFDYSFVKAAMEQAGLRFNPLRLCSVRYARKITPGLKSYALANLCKYFNVRNEAAHRALGDAEATAEIFTQLLAIDKEEQWRIMARRIKGEYNLPAHLPAEQFHNLPEAPGVYYFLNKAGKPLYIGKAKNLKKRVSTHFGTAQSSLKSQAFKREIYRIDYTLTGSELIAALLEDHKIRHYRPAFNKAQKRNRVAFGVFCYRNQKGEYCLQVNKISGQQGYLQRFYAVEGARNYCAQVAERYNLNPKLCGIYTSGTESLPPLKDHNERFETFLQDCKQKRDEEEVLVLKGRYDEEYGFVWLVGGILQGIGFMKKWPGEASAKEIEKELIPLQSSSTEEAIIERIRMEQVESISLRLTETGDEA